MDVIRAASRKTGPKAPGCWPVEIRATVEFTFPIVLARRAWVALMIADMAIIRRLGSAKFTGESLSLKSVFLVWLVCFGIVSATTGFAV